MPKSKKSQNEKPKFILIYGPIGVGKLTVAGELKKLVSDSSLIHNHMILNLVEELFPRGHKTSYRADLYMKFFNIIIQEAAEKKKNIIMTHPYSYSFTYKNGISDTDFIKNLIETFTRKGGLSYPVHLFCNIDENIKRASSKERKVHNKLINKIILREILNREDCITSPDLKNNFKIDVTKINAKKVALIIKDHFKL
jgi:hypothetical protein